MKMQFMMIMLVVMSLVGDFYVHAEPVKKEALSAFRSSFAPDMTLKEVEAALLLEDVTGLEWLGMTMSRRTEHVLARMFALTQNGIKLRKTTNDYFYAVQKNLHRDESLYQVPMGDILSAFIYETEPASRGILDEIKKSA